VNAQRWALLTVVAVVLLFAAAVALGGGERSVGAVRSGLTDALAAMWPAPPSLPPQDVVANGFAAGTFQLVAGLPTVAQVRASDHSVRLAQLRLLSGGPVQVELRPKGERGLTVRSRLTGDAPQVELQVFAAGAVLQLVAAGGPGPVLVQLAAE
jgi:hypothetical protein